MNYTDRKYFLPFILALVMIFFVMSIPVSAVTVTGVSGVEVTVDSNGSISESGGTVTATVKGSFTTRKTTTITVTNTSGSTATISFNYTVSDHDSSVSTIDNLAGANSGSYSVLLTAGATKTFTMCSNRFTSATTATAKLSNFKVEAAAAESDVTVTYGNLGSVTLDGNKVDSGSVKSVSSTTGATFVAVPGNNKFVAWINPTTNDVLSTSASYNVIPTEDMTIKAVFTNAASAPVFWADGSTKLFESLSAATSYASSASNKVIILAADGTLPSGNYTIPAGVTLLIPFDSANTVCTENPTTHDDAYTAPTVYRTLTMAEGANITVNGAISVSGKVSSKYKYNGMPSGPLGFINMQSSSNITVNSGANLYVWGYIKGSGSVTVNSGGTVHECFQIADYRGGDVTSTMTSSRNATSYGVFPFNQYYLQNVEVPMTLHTGATENGFGAVSVTLAGTQKMSIPFIGASDSMFVIGSGYIVKDYMEGTGRTEIEVYGDITVTRVSIDMRVSLVGSVTIDTDKYALPIPNHMTISLKSGSINMNQSMAFLPGSELYIGEGTTCTLGSDKNIYVYDWDNWIYNNGANGYAGTTNLPYVNLPYVPGGNGTIGRSEDALVQIDGTVDVSAGSVYVTAGGANIYSTGTGVVKVKATTETTAYQVITNNTDISSWPAIAMHPAKLRNGTGANKEYEETASYNGIYTYDSVTQEWHSFGSGVVTNPTCVDAGYTTYTCAACGYSYQDNPTAALGHTEVVDAAVAATCTEAGKTEGKHCSVCNEVIVAQTEVAALGHTEVIDAAVAPTCTATGLSEGKHCSVCNTVLVAQTEVAALGHTEVIDAAVAATCTDPGLTEGKHCSVCNAVIVAQDEVEALGHSYSTVVTDPTCTEKGYTTYTCACGNSYIEEIPATDHNFDKDPMVCDICDCFQFYANVVLGNNLDMMFAFPKRTQPDWAGCYAEIVRTYADGTESETTTYYFDVEDAWGEVIIDGVECYTVTYSGFAAKEMCDTITLTVYDKDGKVISISWTDSIQAYALRMLEKATDETSPNEKLQTVIVDMLNYGAACQNYFTYNTKNLANAGLSASGTTEYPKVTPFSHEGKTTWFGANLVTESNIQFALAFRGLSEGSSVTYSFTGHKNNPVEVTVPYERMLGTDTDYPYIYIPELVVADANSVITVTVTTGTKTETWSESVASYVARNGKQEDGDVFYAFLIFANSAKEYLHNK